MNVSPEPERSFQNKQERIAAGQPQDQAGNPNTNGPRNRPYDFVLASRRLAKLEVPTVVGGRSFANGLVFDSRLWNPPPPPVRWDDTARNMQHLPVMKTFMVPMR